MAAEKYRPAPVGQRSASGGQKGSADTHRRAGRSGARQSSTLSPEERRRRARLAREEAQRRREEKARVAARRRVQRRALFRRCFVLSLVFVVLYWAVVALIITKRSDGSEDLLPVMIFTDGNREADKTLSPETGAVNGVMYLAVTELEQYFTISQFGDHRTRSFAIASTGEYATFALDSDEAVINGVPVSLTHPALLREDVLYLPLDFFASAMTCFTFSPAVASYGADVLTFFDTDPGFLFAPAPQSDPVDYASVPRAPVVS